NVALDKGDVGLGNVDNVSAADLRDRSTHTGTQPASTITGLAAVATSGSYDDLDDKPTIPQAPVNADWNATSGLAQILNKPELGDLAAKNSVGVADIDATGTPSSATYLRGDGTWETPAGGGSGTPATVEELRALTGDNTVTPSVIALAHA